MVVSKAFSLMKSFLFLFILSSLALADDFAPVLTKALTSQALSGDERKQLVKLVLRKHHRLLELLKEGLEGDAAKAAQIILPEIEADPKEDKGENRLGAAVGWFVEYQGDQMTSFPVLSKIIVNAAADQAELRVGDVIWKLEDESMHHAHSRNHFIHLLKLWPEKQPMQMIIRRERDGNNKRLEYAYDRRKKLKISVMLAKP